MRCPRMVRLLPALAPLLFCLPIDAPTTRGEEPGSLKADGVGSLTFEKNIRPILRAHCFDCHGATQELEGGLDLRQVRRMTQGGDSGPALAPGSPSDSYLLNRVRDGEMPPGEQKLSPEELATLEQWILAGAPTARPEPEHLPPGLGITPEEREYWAFQPIARPSAPEPPPTLGDRVRTPIDAFLLAAMPDGWTFSPDAPREVLVRRLYFDLLGLPPAAEEIERWAGATEPDWYERLVDQLLDSPHYGERWARHWLDVAGYADSEGYTTADAERAWAWKYRDYVIQSFNNDKPWDRFLLEQLAGDELAGPIRGDLTPEQIELLTATGFLRMAADGTGSGADNAEGRNQVMIDTLRIVSTSLLGMSVACAQCHDHRYDPIPQADYYSLRAVFEPALDWQAWRTPPQRLISLYTQAQRESAVAVESEAQVIVKQRGEKEKEYMDQALEQELGKFDESLRENLRDAYRSAANERTPEQKELLDKHPSVNITPGVLYQYLPKAAEELKSFDQRIAETRAKRPPEEFLRALTEPEGHAPATRLFHRGDPQQPQQETPPADLSVVAAEDAPAVFPADDPRAPTTGRRTSFARWLTNGSHPLLARVLVNRFWMHHFGRGIVETPADFGRLGTRPTHPQLLDWLAAEFMQREWSLKQLHRMILLSTAWRQSSLRGEHDAEDPDNHYYWRQNVRRIEAETLRDQMLFVASRLDPRLYGPPEAIHEDDTGQVIVSGENQRRSVYVKMRRSQPVAVLQAFDAPVMETNCERRTFSTAATQSLMLMNSEFTLQVAQRVAERVMAGPSGEAIGFSGFVPPELFAAGPSPWSYGFGAWNQERPTEVAFDSMPHWTGTAWQGGKDLPDARIGWSLLNQQGGHAGADGFSPIRRWTASASGVASITGKLRHASENGDGVRGSIVSSRQGLMGDWIVAQGEVESNCGELAVEAGDVIDFITRCNADVNADSFTWQVRIAVADAQGDVVTFDSERDWQGPLALVSEALRPSHLRRAWRLLSGRDPSDQEWLLTLDFVDHQLRSLHRDPRSLSDGVSPARRVLTNFCQTMLSSNEFLYVD